MSDDLVTFLRERLDEDEQMAQAATPGGWRWDLSGGRFDGDPGTADPGTEWGHSGPDLVGTDGREVITSTGYDADNVIVNRADAAHIARHAPARVLADVAATRLIVEWLHKGWPLVQHRPSSVAGLLQHLALSYASHESYRPEWAP